MDFWEWCRGLLFGSPEEQRAAEEEERAERARLEAERKQQEVELQRKQAIARNISLRRGRAASSRCSNSYCQCRPGYRPSRCDAESLPPSH